MSRKFSIKKWWTSASRKLHHDTWLTRSISWMRSRTLSLSISANSTSSCSRSALRWLTTRQCWRNSHSIRWSRTLSVSCGKYMIQWWTNSGSIWSTRKLKTTSNGMERTRISPRSKPFSSISALRWRRTRWESRRENSWRKTNESLTTLSIWLVRRRIMSSSW